MNRLAFRLGRRNIWRNPKRSVLTMLAIAIGVWSAIAMSVFTRGISRQLEVRAIRNLSGHVKLSSESFRDNPVIDHRMLVTPELSNALDAMPEIRAWSTRLRVPGVVMSERESAGVTIVGIDPARERELSFIGTAHHQGARLADELDTKIFIGRRLAKRLETGIGKKIVLMTEGLDGKIADRGYRISGLYDADLEATELHFVFVGRETLRKMLGNPEGVSEVSLLLSDEGVPEGVASALRQVALPASVFTWEELEPFTVAIRDMQGGFLYVWNLIVVITIGFGLVNTMFMAIFERLREFGLYQALGMKPRMLTYQIVAESFVLLVGGLCLGNALAALTVFFFEDGLDLSAFAEGLEHFGASTIIYPSVQLNDVLIANATVMVLALLSSLYPAWRAGRLDPAESLRRAG